MQDIDYKEKYLKYKAKYLELKGGVQNGLNIDQLNDALKTGLYYYFSEKDEYKSVMYYKKIISFVEKEKEKVIVIKYEGGEAKVGMNIYKIGWLKRTVETKTYPLQTKEITKDEFLKDLERRSSGIFNDEQNVKIMKEILEKSHREYSKIVSGSDPKKLVEDVIATVKKDKLA